MKFPWTSLMAAVAGLVAGISLSRPAEVESRPLETVGESAGSKPSRFLSSDARSGRIGRAGPLPAGHRLQDLFALDWRLLYLDESDHRLLKADVPTLKGWLHGLLDKEKQGRSLHVVNLRNRVIRQLYDREGTGFLAWSEALGNASVMGECLRCLGRDDAKSAVAWVSRFKAIQERANAPESDRERELKMLLRDLHDATVFQSPAAIGEIHRLFEADLKGCLEPGSLPDEFDHATFLKSLDSAQVISFGGAGRVVASWAMRDRHAACDFARSLDAAEVPGAIRLVPEVFQAVGRIEGEESAARWLSDELADASNQERKRILGGLFPYQSPSPATFATILRGLPRDEDTAIFREAMKRWFPNGEP